MDQAFEDGEDQFFFEDDDDADRFFNIVNDEDRFFDDSNGDDRPFKKLETEANHHGGSCGGTVIPPPEPSPTDGRSQQEDNEKTDSADEFLAHRFAALTMEERQQAMNDIHCVSEPFSETPEFVDEKILELSALLNGGSSVEGDKSLHKAYDMVLEQNPEYVKDRSFLLQDWLV